MQLTTIKRISEIRATLGDFPKEWPSFLLRGDTRLMLTKTAKFYRLSGNRMVCEEQADDYFCIPEAMFMEIQKLNRRKPARILFFNVLYGIGAVIIFAFVVLFWGAVSWRRWDFAVFILLILVGLTLFSVFLERRGFWRRLLDEKGPIR